jgi:hypothetical protein
MRAKSLGRRYMVKYRMLCRILTGVIITLFVALPLFGKDDKIATPKEFGAYVKTTGGLKRLLPNVVQEENGMLFVESNSPPRYALKDVEYFIIYGTHNMDVLTLNPLVFARASALGKARYIFGKNIEFALQKRGNNQFVIKPKGLLGRGYFSLWIEDTAWDFIIE